MRITQVHTIHITSLIGNDFHDLVHLETWRRCKTCFDVVIQATTWIPWRYRNRICFDMKPPRYDNLVEEIMILSHSMILHRNKNFNPSWIDWISNPIDACTKLL